MKQNELYSGGELESMDFAVNYHRWILKTFRPFLGRQIVEVGAGAGSFSELLLDTRPSALTMLEPSANLYPVLAARLPAFDKEGVGQALQCTLSSLGAAGTAGMSTRPDSVLYVNVLEHIEDDEGELASVYSLLSPGGRVLIFVPAHDWLMSAMDRQMGHFRRYTLGQLKRKCRTAGFDIRYSSHFDFFGIAPWWLKYRLMGSTTMESGLVQFYDRCIVPISQMMEGAISPPIGKNVVVVGQKAN